MKRATCLVLALSSLFAGSTQKPGSVPSVWVGEGGVRGESGGRAAVAAGGGGFAAAHHQCCNLFLVFVCGRDDTHDWCDLNEDSKQLFSICFCMTSGLVGHPCCDLLPSGYQIFGQFLGRLRAAARISGISRISWIVSAFYDFVGLI